MLTTWLSPILSWIGIELVPLLLLILIVVICIKL